MRSAHLLALVTFLLLSGCTDQLALSPSDEWAEARARRGDSPDPSHYAFETRSACYCIVNVTYCHRVEVRDGSVVAVTPVDGVPFPPVRALLIWRTVPHLFERARRRREVTFIERQDVEYDPTVGYPRRISVVCGRQVADCEQETMVRGPRGVQ